MNRERARAGSGLSEEELVAMQMAGGDGRDTEMPDYYKWANEPDAGVTLDDDLFKGFLSKEITLANLNKEEVAHLNELVDMAEWTKRMLNPAWDASMGNGEEEFKVLNHKAALLARISRGRGGFERRQQTKQVSERRVTTDRRGSGGVKGFLSKVFGGG